MTDQAFSIAVFPFLKTSGPVRIGEHTFRSTADVVGLPPDQAKAVTEIARMLFVQSDLRVRSASYAIIPPLDFDYPSAAIDRLKYLRAVVAYLYASPHEVFGNVFLSPEEVSLVLFTPSPISVFLARPEHHTEEVSEVEGRPAPDKHHNVPGYKGIYNFRYHFWIEPGSRLYGPKPHITLNIAQDLCRDLEHLAPLRPDYSLVLGLLEKPSTSASLRIYSALHWFNAANEDANDPAQSVLDLAVAFEALLRLPDFSKKEQLVDAIALLLGRIDRLDEWADQFYSARSQVAHEGRLQDGYFYVPVNGKRRHPAGLFGSLMLYGRQVFQLCLGTLLVGVDLADRSDLREKLTTNNERYQKICDLLQVETGEPSGRLRAIEPIVRALERYRFIPSGELSTGTLISAVRSAAATLAECKHALAQEVSEALMLCAATKRGDGELTQLASIERLNRAFEGVEAATATPEARIVESLVDVTWMNLFQRFYSLKERRER